MSVVALIAIAGASAVSTVFGLISSVVRDRTERSAKKDHLVHYNLILTRDGQEIEYRIDAPTKEGAEAKIKEIIEGN